MGVFREDTMHRFRFFFLLFLYFYVALFLHDRLCFSQGGGVVVCVVGSVRARN